MVPPVSRKPSNAQGATQHSMESSEPRASRQPDGGTCASRTGPGVHSWHHPHGKGKGDMDCQLQIPAAMESRLQCAVIR